MLNTEAAWQFLSTQGADFGLKALAAIATMPKVMTAPAPDIEALQFTPEGPPLAVRPDCHSSHCWQVYFDTHKAVVATFGAAGYPAPGTPITPRNR